MKTITVVGAGFSGLSLAYYLKREGFDVHVLEKQNKTGGLIQTHHRQFGLVETAANAFLCDADLEDFFSELKVPFAERLKSRSRRYIFWQKPRRWPLSLKSTLRVGLRLYRLLRGDQSMRPQPQESIREWGRRCLDADFTERMLEPGLQGIYAGDPKKLSATLIFKTFLKGSKKQKSRYRGSVAPDNGMGQLIDELTKELHKSGVMILTDSEFSLESPVSEPHVICTSAWNAAEILKSAYPQVSQTLKSLEVLPLVTVTCFFKESGEELQGFGCLFPRSQKFSSLGVLFNDCIFVGRIEAQEQTHPQHKTRSQEARSQETRSQETRSRETRSRETRSETWILGGAQTPDIAAYSDQQILEMIRADREKLPGAGLPLLDFEITRWSRALPHYTVKWEKELESLDLPEHLFLHGNYLGEIGLSRIHARSKRLAKKLKELYG